MQRAIIILRKQWSKAVIDKNVKEVMNCYTKGALFKGTLRSKPVQGKKFIKPYFDDFVHKVKDIKFSDDNYLFHRDDLYTEMGTYTFYLTDDKHNNEKVIANYQFIYELQKDNQPKILSHFSSLASCD
jgi:hypothetical protein